AQKVDIMGFYESTDGKYRKFEVLNDTESEANFNLMSDLYRGLVTMHVFRNKPPTVKPDPTDLAPRPQPPEVIEQEAILIDASTITMGVGGVSVKAIRTAGSLQAAQEALASKTSVQIRND